MKRVFLSGLFVSLLWLNVIGGLVCPNRVAAQTPAAPAQKGGIVIVPSLEKRENARPFQEKDFGGYVMVYLKDQTQSAYMAVSRDGYTFTDLNNGQPIFDGALLAEQKGVRDPQFQFEEFKEFLDPYAQGLPGAMQQQLADRYTELFGIFYCKRDKIDRITLWGVHDGMSWKNGYPVPGRTNYPLLYDRNRQSKPAFHTVLSLPFHEK